MFLTAGGSTSILKSIITRRRVGKLLAAHLEDPDGVCLLWRWHLSCCGLVKDSCGIYCTGVKFYKSISV